MSKGLIEEQRQEAIKRIELLTEKYNLTPEFLKYFKEENSALIFGNVIADVGLRIFDVIIDDFQNKYNGLVYGGIYTGDFFCLLYVSKNTDKWEYERVNDKNYQYCYVFNLEDLKHLDSEIGMSEFGDIILTSQNGCLIKKG